MKEGFEAVEEFRGIGQGGLIFTLDTTTTPCVLRGSAIARQMANIMGTYRQSIAYAFAGRKAFGRGVALSLGWGIAGACNQTRELQTNSPR